jgi:hypothetical protein
MRKMTRGARGWLFGAGVMAALGFGGAQAMASPVSAEAKVCNPTVCNRICQAIPGSIGGFCASDGSCQCYIGK